MFELSQMSIMAKAFYVERTHLLRGEYNTSAHDIDNMSKSRPFLSYLIAADLSNSNVIFRYMPSIAASYEKTAGSGHILPPLNWRTINMGGKHDSSDTGGSIQMERQTTEPAHIPA